MLFSEAGQKIFELDRVAAFIWCKLAQGASLEEIYQRLGALDIDEQTARQFTRQAVNVWIDRGFLEVDWRMPADCAFSAVLGRHRIGIRAANRDLLNRLLPLFCVPDQNAGCDVDITVEAMMLDDSAERMPASPDVKSKHWHLRSKLTSPSGSFEAVVGSSPFMPLLS
ncbi:PqqD family protein [Bradyrhizobium sp. 160]|nr:PqqD family protein [Bradyrhizobium sp. 160]